MFKRGVLQTFVSNLSEKLYNVCFYLDMHVNNVHWSEASYVSYKEKIHKIERNFSTPFWTENKIVIFEKIGPMDGFGGGWRK